MTVIASYFHHIHTFNRNIRLFLVTAFLIGFTVDGGLYSVVFNLYLLRLGYNAEVIGQINSSGLLTFALCGIPAGLLGKYIGTRRTMIIGLGIMGFACGLLPTAESIPLTWQTSWLALSFMGTYLGLALYFVNSAPFITEMAQTEVRDQVFSIQIAALAFSAFIGSLVGGFLPGLFANILSTSLQDPAPYRYPLILSAVLMLPAFITMGMTHPLEPSPQPPIKEAEISLPATTQTAFIAFPWILLLVLIIVRLLQVSGMAAGMIFFNVYLDTNLSVPTTQIGIIIAISRLFSIPAALLAPLLTTRKGSIAIIIWASLGISLAMLPLALIPHWTAASLGYIAAMTISALRFPVFLAFSMTLVSPRHRGLVAGGGEAAAGLSFAVISFSGGYIITSWGYQPLFLLAAALTFLGTIAFWAYFKPPHQR